MYFFHFAICLNVHISGDTMEKTVYGSTVASAVAAAIFVFLVLVNVVFIIGVLFRQCRTICCGRCMGENFPKVSEA